MKKEDKFEMPRFFSIFLCCLAMIANAAATGGQLAYDPVNIGKIKPKGWLLRQMELDLQDGIAGHYDDISSNVSQNLFATQTRVPGVWYPGPRGHDEKSWWAGEHEGYWMEGLIRMAILTGRQTDLDRAESWVAGILARFDQTGYAGMYSPSTRLPDTGFDGELWTQSRAFQGLLAWYEYTGNTNVLNAVEQTVRMTIDHYQTLGTYFGRPGMDGGGTHGVGYMDTLEWLWRLTDDSYYADAAVWLYADFCQFIPNDDLNVDLMQDAEKLWAGHTPHAAEAMHMPGVVAFFTGDTEFKTAATNVYVKLARHTSPGGGFVAGDVEAIAETYGGGDEGNEYCGMTEAVYTLDRLFMYEGNLFAADWIERCALNGVQGARFHPDNQAVIYLSKDNTLTGDPGGRWVYSASHSVAACCTLNSTRLLPAYVQAMWYQVPQQPVFRANLYGASELEIEVGGQPVKIVQETEFPFSDQIVFRIETTAPVYFEMELRIPPNSGSVGVVAGGAQIDAENRIVRVGKTWANGDTVEVDFNFQITRQIQHDGLQAYYNRGPLLFALQLPDQIASQTEIGTSGFYDYWVTPVSSEGWNYTIDPQGQFTVKTLPGNPLLPWDQPTVALEGTLLNGTSAAMVTLVPMGSTLLRRSTFPLAMENRIFINPNKTGNMVWNTAIWGDPAAVPTAGSEYVDDGSASGALLAMGPHGEFLGEKLTLGSGAVVYGGGGGVLPELVLDGGSWQTRANGTAVLSGNVQVAANSSFMMVDGNLELNAELSCDAGITLKLQSWSKAGKTLTLKGTDQGFYGTFSVLDTGVADFTWDLRFNQSHRHAALRVEGQTGNPTRAAIYQLVGDIAFKSVVMPNGSGGLVTLAPGVYGGAALALAGVSGTYFNDLGGTILVNILSGYEVWAGGWDADIGSAVNDYDGDLLDNLAEYGLGGDPTNQMDVGWIPVCGLDAGALVYVHAQRTDDADLSYYLETKEDLVEGSWINSGYSVTGTNVTGATFDFVTNTIPTDADQGFARLVIETE